MRAILCTALAALATATLLACGGGSSSPSSHPVQVQLQVRGAAPLQAAVQLGGGRWTSLAVSGGTATFQVPSSTAPYAVAVLCPTTVDTMPLVQLETILELSAADTVSPTLLCRATATVPLDVSYDVSALPAALEAAVSVGSTGLAAFGTGVSGTSHFAGVAPGVQDIGVAAYADPATGPAVGVEIIRGVNVTGAPIIVPPMPASDAAGSAPITVTGLPGGYTDALSAFFVTSGGTSVGIDGNGQASYALLPATATAAGDYYAVFAQAQNAVGDHAVATVSSFSTPHTLGLALPVPLDYAGPAPAAFPTFLPSYSGFSVAGSRGILGGVFWQSGSVRTTVLAYATSAFLGQGGSLTLPDLSAVPGFSAPPPATTTITWLAGAFTETAPYLPLLDPVPPSGETAQFVVASGQYAEP